MLKNILLAFVLLSTLGCSGDQPSSQPAQNTAESTVTSASAPLLVFFLNPDGGPCRMQQSILDKMSAELKGKVEIRPVSTTVPEDRNIFYAYGIRGLPTILLAEATGKEIKRLVPGVQPTEAVRELLNFIPAK